MNYNYIKTNTPVGDTAILTDRIRTYFSSDLSTYPTGSLILEMNSLDYHDPLFGLHPYYFVTNEFKETLEKQNLFKFEFQKIDVFIAGLDLKENHPNHGFDENSFWRILVGENNTHVIIYKTRLIVSDVLLRYLLEYHVFKYETSGSHCGKEYEFINNVFRVRGSIDEYFEKYYKIDQEIIEKKHKYLIEISKKEYSK